MKHLFSDWESIKKKITKAPRLAILLDYDGTLSSIASTPKDASLQRGIKKTLTDLRSSNFVAMGIVSGRRLKNVRSKIGLRSIYYVGNHGLEIQYPSGRLITFASKRFCGIIKQIKKALKKKISSFKGIFLEDKKLTLTVHWRLVSKKDLPNLKSVFTCVCAPYVKKGRISIRNGKKSWEIRPPAGWHNKGTAVRRILNGLGKSESLPIYIGDDATDEDAFRTLKNNGISIFVGKPKKCSSAKYYLKSVQEVAAFLRKVTGIINR